MSYCPICGAHVEANWNYCQNCGRFLRGTPNISAAPIYTVARKDPMIALLLALIPGLVGIWGIGHFYVERITKGILLLFLGIFLAIIMIFSFLICDIIIFIIGFFIWLWQGIDAYFIAKATQTSYRYY